MEKLKREILLTKLGESSAVLLFVIIFAGLGTSWLIVSHAATPTVPVELETGTVTPPATKNNDATASSGSSIQFGTAPVSPPPPAACAVSISATLVNSCRPWMGASANKYPQVASDTKSQLLYHEQRLGRQLDVLHVYNPVGSNSLNTTAQYFINRANTYVMQNWKPAAVWADAGGGNASVNATIDQMADSIKTVAPHKIFLTLYHEPENDVSSGNCTGNASGAASGSPTDYVNMWHNVRARFDAKGVNNVVWVMNYMSFSGWDCLVPQMWPGNSYVDWINWDPYSSGSGTWNTMMSRFYNFLSQNSDTTHNYLSKTWGINETGPYGKTNAQLYTFWDDAAAAVRANTYPRIKMYLPFDSMGSLGDHRVGYDSNGTLDPVVQQHYNAFANTVLNYSP